jgi:DNA repair photolyase
MRALADAGVAARLFIMPILPRLTDDEKNLRALLLAARDAGAIGAESNVLFLRPGTREIFLDFLAVDFPRLVPEYERLYRGAAYAPAEYVRQMEERVQAPGGRSWAQLSAPRGSPGSAVAPAAEPGLVAGPGRKARANRCCSSVSSARGS